jgi:putative ABC transport system permease protein
MQSIIERGHNEGYAFLADAEGEGAISAVLVQIDHAKNAQFLAFTIKQNNAGVEVLLSQGIFSSIAETLQGLISYIHVFSVLLWGLAVIILAAVFSGTIHERKKEFAILRIIGATRKKLTGIVLAESGIAAAVGGVAGIALAAFIVFPFNVYISEKLQLPYREAPPGIFLALMVFCFLLSFVVGPLSSLYSALSISKAETYFTMREGE